VGTNVQGEQLASSLLGGVIGKKRLQFGNIKKVDEKMYKISIWSIKKRKTNPLVKAPNFL